MPVEATERVLTALTLCCLCARLLMLTGQLLMGPLLCEPLLLLQVMVADAYRNCDFRFINQGEGGGLVPHWCLPAICQHKQKKSIACNYKAQHITFVCDRLQTDEPCWKRCRSSFSSPLHVVLLKLCCPSVNTKYGCCFPANDR